MDAGAGSGASSEDVPEQVREEVVGQVAEQVLAKFWSRFRSREQVYSEEGSGQRAQRRGHLLEQTRPRRFDWDPRCDGVCSGALQQ